jgi:hypothetical protein
MRFINSRHERPATTRMRVVELETTVLLPLEPLASTVIRTILRGYAGSMWKGRTIHRGRSLARYH